MKHLKTLHAHLKHHHKKYLFGIFGSFAVVKAILLFAGFLGIAQLSSTFAQTPGELNSGNITQAPYSCLTGTTTCNLINKSITSIAPDTFINHTNLTTLNIYPSQITFLESGAFNGLSGLTILDIHSNYIASLENGDFNGLPNLTELYLNSNHITSIESGTFNGLSKLTTLDIGSNRITSLESGDFNGLSGLTYLSLYSNQITSLESGDFDGLSSVLTTLYVHDNQISTIENGTFLSLSGLTTLNISSNQITSLESGIFNGLSGLTTLDFHSNQITFLESGNFLGLSKLTYLSIYSNQIASLESGDFNGLSGLTTLDLHSNQIASIENNYFLGLSGLTALYLNSNQITSIKSGDLRIIASKLTALYLQSNQITYIESGTFLSGNGFSKLNTLNLNPNCYTSGSITIKFKISSNSTINNTNCVPISGAVASDFITLLGSKGYTLTNNYYVGNRTISFNYFSSTNTFLAPIIMQSTNSNSYLQDYYQNNIEVQYESGTVITYSGNAFTGILRNPLLFATGIVPGLTGVVSIMRFGALTHRIDFSQPITIRIPALGGKFGDIVKIYSSDEENIYGTSTPHWTFEKTGILINADSSGIVIHTSGIPYVEFTGTHASRYALSELSDLTAPIGTITYNPTSGAMTSGNVIATIVLNESGIITNNGGSLGYTFTGNDSFIFEFQDTAGNTGNATATVDWIDKVAPTAEIIYSTTGTTNQNVTATVTGFSEEITGLNFTGHIFTGNDSFIFEFQDLAGNTGNATATVDWIFDCGNEIVETGEICDNGVLNGQAGYCNTSCNGTVAQPGGGAGGMLPKDVCTPERDCSSSYYDTICGPCSSTGEVHNDATSCTAYSDELNNAYIFAYDNGITTIKNCISANLNGNLIRSDLAKMVSQFAIKVLKMKPDTKKTSCVFSDMKNESKEMQFYATIACQLGLMGLDTDGITPKATFNPDDIVDRAQFGTILSRILRGTKYAGELPFYVKHLNALKKNAIMNDITKPFAPEMRGRVMLMLQRSSEKK